MKARLVITKCKRGYIVEIDNGYGQSLALTDVVGTVEEAETLIQQFLNTSVHYDI